MVHLMVLAADRPGILRRILGVYESRRYQVRSLATGPAGPAGFLRIHLVLDEPADRARRLAAQLARLVDVASAQVVEPSRAVGRELALVKVLLDHPGRRPDLLQVAQVFRARVVDVAPRSLVLELTGDPAKVDAFLALAGEFGPVEVMRTGVAALGRGSRILPGSLIPAHHDGTNRPEPAWEDEPAYAVAAAAGGGPAWLAAPGGGSPTDPDGPGSPDPGLDGPAGSRDPGRTGLPAAAAGTPPPRRFDPVDGAGSTARPVAAGTP